MPVLLPDDAIQTCFSTRGAAFSKVEIEPWRLK